MYSFSQKELEFQLFHKILRYFFETLLLRPSDWFYHSKYLKTLYGLIIMHQICFDNYISKFCHLFGGWYYCSRYVLVSYATNINSYLLQKIIKNIYSILQWYSACCSVNFVRLFLFSLTTLCVARLHAYKYVCHVM